MAPVLKIGVLDTKTPVAARRRPMMGPTILVFADTSPSLLVLVQFANSVSVPRLNGVRSMYSRPSAQFPACAQSRHTEAVTIAQLPESAAYDSMPRSAIAAGLADYILHPDDMPARLVEQASRIGNPVVEHRPAPATVEDAVPAICDLVRRRTGHDSSCYKGKSLVRRISRRMDALQITSPDAYLSGSSTMPAKPRRSSRRS